MKKISFLLIFLLITGCGIYKKVDGRKVPVNVEDRVKKNIQEGRSFKLMDAANRGTGSFEFASSNEMWRASIDLLDFTPFSNVDYSGGIIITDWFSDGNSNNEYLKITVRFLSNEIQTNSLKVTVHNKTCDTQNICSVSKIKSKIEDELITSILKKAALLEKEKKTKK